MENKTENALLMIEAKLMQDVLNTLAQLPYGQIERLMTALRNDLAKNNPQRELII